MSVATLNSDAIGPLTQTHHREVAAAQERAHKIRKAAAVAAFNGWTIGICAACSAPFALFSLDGLAVAIGLSVASFNEFRGRKRLLRFEPQAATFLGWNQVGFLSLIVVYCLWTLAVGLTSEGPFAAEFRKNPELTAAFDSASDFDQLYKVLIFAIYGTVIAFSCIFQGLNAIYYFTRRKHVEAYLQKTPPWVLDLQRLTH